MTSRCEENQRYGLKARKLFPFGDYSYGSHSRDGGHLHAVRLWTTLHGVGPNGPPKQNFPMESPARDNEDGFPFSTPGPSSPGEHPLSSGQRQATIRMEFRSNHHRFFDRGAAFTGVAAPDSTHHSRRGTKSWSPKDLVLFRVHKKNGEV